MNRLISLLSLTAFVLIVSCQKADVDNEANIVARSAKVFTASFENANTRTYVDNDLYMYWTADDRLSIFTSTFNSQYRFDGQTGANSGSFSKVQDGQFVSGNSVTTNYGVYPYNAATSLTKEEKIQLILPAIQAYAPNSFGLGANTMVAVTNGISDTFLPFKNVCGYLVVKLYGEGKVTKVIFEGNNGEKIAGAATVTASYGSTPTVAMSNEATTSITIDCGEGVELGKAADISTDFWFVIPPTTFENGFTIRVVGDGVMQMVKKTSISRDIQRNVVNQMSVSEVVFDTPIDDNILFVDELVKAKLVNAFDSNNDGEISYAEAAGAASMDGVFEHGGNYVSFNEFQFFTSITKIPDSLFYDCVMLEEIILPDNIRSIGRCSFCNCSSLEKINIPNNTNSIQKGAFDGCNSLTSLYLDDLSSWCKCSMSTSPFIASNNGKIFVEGCEITEVTLPSVNRIGNYCFYGCTNIHKVVLGEARSIGSYAFSGCTGLVSITLPDCLTTISGHAFSGCLSLTSVRIPGSVSSILNNAFSGCENINTCIITDYSSWCSCILYAGAHPFTSSSGVNHLYLNDEEIVDIILPVDITNVGDYLFYNCNSIQSVKVGTNVSSIGKCAFRGCKGLTDLFLPDGLKIIGKWAFTDCLSLRKIELPNSLSLIDFGAFQLDSLEHIRIPEDIDSVGNQAFADGRIDTLIVPEKVRSLTHSVFNHTIVKKLVVGTQFPDLLETIIGVEDLVLLEGVTRIEDDAFGYWSGAKGIKSITIPPSVQEIGEAFSYCSELKELHINDIKAWCECKRKWTNVGYFCSANANGGRLFLEDEEIINLSIPDGTKEIKSGAFAGCYNIVTVSIPESVGVIGACAFARCSKLKNVSLPESVISIGASAFRMCSSLSSILIPDSVTSIRNYAFSNCDNISSFTIPGSVKELGDGILCDCDNLISVDIQNGVEIISNNMFSECKNLSSVIIPGSVTSIGRAAFYNCWNLSSIKIPETVTIIGSSAFYCCSSLDIKTVPSGVHSLERDVFNGCLSLTSFTIPSGVNTIGINAFRGCGISSVVIPDSVISIGDSSFEGCRYLTSVTIPTSVKSIGYGAFLGSSNLSVVNVLPDSPPVAGGSMFSDNDITIYVPAQSVDAYKSADYWKDYASRIRAIE